MRNDWVEQDVVREKQGWPVYHAPLRGQLGLSTVGDVHHSGGISTIRDAASMHPCSISIGPWEHHLLNVLVLTCDGTVYSWGDNNCGQCGHSGPEDVPRPKMIKTLGAFLLGAFQHVSGGVLHSVAIVNRNYYYHILTDFYKEHDETRIPNIPMILRKYQVR